MRKICAVIYSLVDGSYIGYVEGIAYPEGPTHYHAWDKIDTHLGVFKREGQAENGVRDREYEWRGDMQTKTIAVHQGVQDI